MLPYFTTRSLILASLYDEYSSPYQDIKQLSNVEIDWVLIMNVIGSTALILRLHMI